ncbi:unnamed protein product [Lathyrus sativus]|nr:unnamed protein product [Lathyrus sativus]
MIIRSLDIREGDSLVKRKRINQIIHRGWVDIFMIQESKLVVVDACIIRSFWNNGNVGWSFVSSKGKFGGIITLWKEDLFEVICNFKREGCLGLKLLWKGSNYYVINVYSPCSLPLRSLLWEKLLVFKDKYLDGEWIMRGDFNLIINNRKRKGRASSRNNSNMLEFSNFIVQIVLVDLPCKGNKYIWFSSNKNSMSRLDSFLLSNSLID